MTAHKRFVFAPHNKQPLPLYVESIGYNHNQEKISRPQGYPYFHWLQTMDGEGTVSFAGKSLSLPRHCGVLLTPHTPHAYEAASDPWKTLYLTFGGPAAGEILAALELTFSSFFRWEPSTPFALYLEEMLERLETNQDVFGIDASADAYRFLGMLSKYGQLQNNTAISRNLNKLLPLIDWMEAHYANPDIGLRELAEVLAVSIRRLNDLFRATLGLTPYAYFLHLRVRKAKELLTGSPQLTIKTIAYQVGFRDVSHFVATFRKLAGMPPERFRKLH